jgi:PAS domain S-box-containing protein
MATVDERKVQQELFALTDRISLELLDRMPNPVLVLDRNGHVQYLNKATERLFGFSLDETRDKDFVGTFISERDQTRERETIQNLVCLQQPATHSCIVRKKNGTEEIHRWSAACFLSSTGKSSLIALFDHREHGPDAAEANLRSAGNLLGVALESVGGEAVVLDRRWKVVHMSKAPAGSHPELLGTICFETLAERQKPCDECPTIRIYESEREVWEETRQSLPGRIEVDNPQCPWASRLGTARMTILPITDCTGDVIGTGIMMVSGRHGKSTDERLAVAQESLNALLSHSLDGIIFVNPATDVILDSNDRACNMLRTEKGALVGTKTADIFLPDSRENYKRLLSQTLLKNGDHFQLRAFTRKDHAPGLAVEVLGVLVDSNGSRRLQLVLRDVSKEHHIMGQLKSQVSLLQNVNDAIISVDMNETVLFLNKKAESVYGLKAEDAICRSFRDVVKYEFLSPASEQDFRTSVREEGFWRGEVVHHRRDGRAINIDTSVSVVSDDVGTPTGLVMVNRDITARKESERKLKRRGDEMAALYEIGQALSRHLSLKDVLSVIHTQVSRLMYARNFYIALYDKLKDEVYFPVYVDELVRKDGTSRKAGNGYTEYVIHTGKPLLLTTETEEKMERNGYEGIGPQALSWLGVPLSSRQEVIGMMAVQSYSKSEQYGEDDLRILSAMSDQAALAIENARMFERVRTSEETYRNLVEATNEGYIIIQERRIALTNRVLAECLSYTTEELAGKNIDSLLTEHSRRAIEDLENIAPLPGDGWKDARLRLVSRHGQEIELDFNFRKLSYEGSPALVGVCPRPRDLQACDRSN